LLLADTHLGFGFVQLQEYVPGDASAMKSVVLLFSRDGRLVAAFTMRRQARRIRGPPA
jgi:hypothetical protein